MSLTYAGIDLLIPTAEVAAWVEANISVRDVYEFVRRYWPGPRLQGLTFPGMQPDRPIKVNCLWWPVGASRWACGHFIVSEARLAQIRQVVEPSGSTYQPAPLVMTWVDATTNTIVDFVSTSLWMLPARPLSQISGLNGHYLISLVDDRFWWWQANTGDVTVTEPTTTWVELYETLGTALDESIDADPVSANYGTPASTLSTKYEDVPPVLDAVAYNCGQRIVRGLDGAIYATNVLTAEADVAANLSLVTARSKQAGGLMALTIAGPNDLNGVLPASVEVVFPRTDSGVPNAAPYTVTVTLSSLGLPEFSGVFGNTSAQKTFHDSATATYAGGGSPTNAAALLALATQTATDYYRYRACPLDIKYAGIVQWEPEGWSDNVEWTYRLNEVSTRIQAGPWNDLTTELMHAPSYGPGLTPTNAHSCTSCYASASLSPPSSGGPPGTGNTYVNNGVYAGTGSFDTLFTISSSKGISGNFGIAVVTVPNDTYFNLQCNYTDIRGATYTGVSLTTISTSYFFDFNQSNGLGTTFYNPLQSFTLQIQNGVASKQIAWGVSLVY